MQSLSKTATNHVDSSSLVAYTLHSVVHTKPRDRHNVMFNMSWQHYINTTRP